MNKEEIYKIITAKINEYTYEIPKDEFEIISDELTKDIVKYLESKREEIERKAFISGWAYGINDCIIANTSLKENSKGITTYDQWKESQNQEQ